MFMIACVNILMHIKILLCTEINIIYDKNRTYPNFSISSKVSGSFLFKVSGGKNMSTPDTSENTAKINEGRGAHTSAYTNHKG